MEALENTKHLIHDMICRCVLCLVGALPLLSMPFTERLSELTDFKKGGPPASTIQSFSNRENRFSSRGSSSTCQPEISGCGDYNHGRLLRNC